MIRKNIEEVIGRFKKLYESDSPYTLIQVREIGEYERGMERRKLNSWDFENELEKYLDFRANNQLKYWERRKDLEDDLIPSVSPWYGIAEHTAFLGGAVDFSDITSYNHTIIDDIEKIDTLKLDENNVWMKRVAGGIAYYKEKWGDVFYPRLRGADGPSDIANIVRGNELFYDVYDYPEETQKLLDFCADAMKFTFTQQKKASYEIEGGTIGGFEVWLPGNSAGHISEDASCMLSKDMYRELFLPALKKSVDGYSHVMLHTHSLGAKMLDIFAEVENISTIELSSDPNAPRAVQVWRDNEKILKDKVTVIAPTKDELFSMKDIISRNRSIIWYYARTREEAEEAIKFVRDINKNR